METKLNPYLAKNVEAQKKLRDGLLKIIRCLAATRRLTHGFRGLLQPDRLPRLADWIMRGMTEGAAQILVEGKLPSLFKASALLRSTHDIHNVGVYLKTLGWTSHITGMRAGKP